MPNEQKVSWVRWGSIILALLGIFWQTAGWKAHADERMSQLELAQTIACEERSVLEKGTRAEIKLLTAEIADLTADIRVLNSKIEHLTTSLGK